MDLRDLNPLEVARQCGHVLARLTLWFLAARAANLGG